MGREQRVNDIIDNERFQRNPSMTMIGKYGVRESKLDEELVDERADCIVSIFASPTSKPLYCDAVRYLTRAYLDEQVKISLEKGRVPAKLFGHIIYKKLCSIGVY